MNKVILPISLLSLVFTFTLQYYVLSADYLNQIKFDSIAIAKTSEADYSTLPNFGGTEIRNVILVLGDGVGLNHILASRLILYGPDGRMYCERFPVIGHSNTAPLDENYITDSGAAATALATGHKTARAMIGMTPDSIPKTSIIELFRDAGYSTGIISTGQLCDATPAGFSVKSPSRKLKEQIARDISNTNINFLMGASEFFYKKGNDSKTPVEIAQSRGYSIVTNKAELMNINSNKILALIDSMNFLKDVYYRDKLPTLAEVTIKAIELLNLNKKGFFLLVEEDGTDDYSHSHDILGIREQMKQMDEAIKVIVDFARKDGKTLVIVTSDHETGGLNIIEANRSKSFMKIAWATGDHTPQPVPVYSIGPYSQHFSGFYENTFIPRKIAEIFNFQHSK